MKDGFGRRKQKGHRGLADHEAEPVEHPSGRCVCKGKETTDLANRWVEGFARASRWAQRRRVGSSSSEEGRREWTGLRQGKMEYFFTS